MHDRVQFESCSSGEVRVQPQYVDCELHLVDHALAGAMTARKEFKIFDFVVLPVAVAVMHGFFWVKFATQMFLHYVAVFHNRVFFAGYKRWHGNPNVAVPFDMPAVLTIFKFLQCQFFPKFMFAISRAVFLLCVKPASRFSTFEKSISAIQARESVFCIGRFTTACRRTFARAIQWISPIFFMVFGEICALHSKVGSAFAATKLYFFFAWCCIRQRKTKCRSTVQTAKTLVCAWIAEKRFLAVLTQLFESHGDGLLFDDGNTIAVRFGIVK